MRSIGIVIVLVVATALAVTCEAGASAGLAWSTFLGGTGADKAADVAVDAGGNIIVVGSTTSTNYPVTAGAFQRASGGGTDVVVTKLAANGTTVLWSTYLGGSGEDIPRRLAIGPGGDVYVTGSTGSANFPVTAGAWRTTFGGGAADGFVTRLAASGGALVYSTFVGGSWDDYPRGIGVDASGAATVAGFTNSVDFPVTGGVVKTTRNPGLFDGADGFVTKLSPNGASAVYSTYLGSSTGTDEIMALALDGGGCATVTGWTTSTGFPTTAGAYDRALGGNHDLFVTRLNATATGYLFSTFVGGTLLDEGYGIAVGPDGATYVTGRTTSADFPVTAGAPQSSLGGAGYYDAIALKLAPGGGSLAWSTYLGGSGNEQGWAIAVYPDGHAGVTGGVDSPNYPCTPGAFCTALAGGSDAFLTMLDVTGTHLAYSTYLGSGGTDCGNAVAFRGNGRIVLGGSTDSGGFPVTAYVYDGVQNSPGTDDIFVADFDAGLSGGNVGVGDAPGPAVAGLSVGPTPFRGGTGIRLTLERAGRVTVRILDLQGRRVREIAGGWMPEGTHLLQWDGRDERGGDPGSGVFFVEAVTGAGLRSARVVRLN